MLIAPVLWHEGRRGFGFESGHLSKRERNRAQPKAPPQWGMGLLVVGGGALATSKSSRATAEFACCQTTRQCGFTRRHNKGWGKPGLHTVGVRDQGGEGEVCPLQTAAQSSQLTPARALLAPSGA